MKAGTEVHFLAGQIFSIGIVALAILPRMPLDLPGTIGGDLSHPFRKALLGLVIIGVVRVLGCHVYHPDDAPWLRWVDIVLGTIHVVGQSFLCLTTAYILQCKVVDFIYIEGGKPGRSLVPALVIVIGLTVTGTVLTETGHSSFACLPNLAEAYSTLPVLKALTQYASVTGLQNGRGSILTQSLKVIEYWYCITSIMACIGILCWGNDNGKSENDANYLEILFEAIRHNQDSGVDDWTRLVLHSVFLNCIDELHHFTPAAGGGGDGSATTTNNHPQDTEEGAAQTTPPPEGDSSETQIVDLQQPSSLALRNRHIS